MVISADSTRTRLAVDTALRGALVAEVIDVSDRERLALYGQLVGIWDIEVIEYPDTGSPRHRSGEWTFGWVLGGTAIQDVWRVHAHNEKPARSGTTIRYPLADGSWRVVWMSPAGGVLDVMSARRAGGEIVQSGRDIDGTEFRWVFYGISENAFRWRAETRTSGGTWTLRQEMTAKRRETPR